MVEIQKKQFVTNGAIPLQQSSDRQCAAEKWIALSFLHPLQQKVGQITDFAPVQQMCVTKPVLSHTGYVLS
ncbi:unnamed protein product [Brassica oleracea]